MQITAKQPYLVQLVCKELVRYFNNYNVENDLPHSGQFTVAEVEYVVTKKGFDMNGSDYFDGIWGQANDDPQRLILQLLAIENLSLAALLAKTSLSEQEVREAIDKLERHDAIQQENDLYTYRVPVMRHWVAKYKPIE